jgi:hypothetical protein
MNSGNDEDEEDDTTSALSMEEVMPRDVARAVWIYQGVAMLLGTIGALSCASYYALLEWMDELSWYTFVWTTGLNMCIVNMFFVNGYISWGPHFFRPASYTPATILMLANWVVPQFLLASPVSLWYRGDIMWIAGGFCSANFAYAMARSSFQQKVHPVGAKASTVHVPDSYIVNTLMATSEHQHLAPPVSSLPSPPTSPLPQFDPPPPKSQRERRKSTVDWSNQLRHTEAPVPNNTNNTNNNGEARQSQSKLPIHTIRLPPIVTSGGGRYHRRALSGTATAELRVCVQLDREEKSDSGAMSSPEEPGAIAGVSFVDLPVIQTRLTFNSDVFSETLLSSAEQEENEGKHIDSAADNIAPVPVDLTHTHHYHHHHHHYNNTGKFSSVPTNERSLGCHTQITTLVVSPVLFVMMIVMAAVQNASTSSFTRIALRVVAFPMVSTLVEYMYQRDLEIRFLASSSTEGNRRAASNRLLIGSIFKSILGRQMLAGVGTTNIVVLTTVMLAIAEGLYRWVRSMGTYRQCGIVLPIGADEIDATFDPSRRRTKRAVYAISLATGMVASSTSTWVAGCMKLFFGVGNGIVHVNAASTTARNVFVETLVGQLTNVVLDAFTIRWESQRRIPVHDAWKVFGITWGVFSLVSVVFCSSLAFTVLITSNTFYTPWVQ